MTPLKIFLSLKAFLEKEESLIDIEAGDPFLHPDIRAMNLRQLADLPFPCHGRSAANSRTLPLAKCA